MDGLYKARRTFFLEIVLAAAFLSVSCAGPSTRVLRRESRV